MINTLKSNKNRIVGTKQLLRLIEKNQISHVFLAEDVDEFIYRRVQTMADNQKIPITKIATMKELGKLCQIQVPTASAGLLI